METATIVTYCINARRIDMRKGNCRMELILIRIRISLRRHVNCELKENAVEIESSYSITIIFRDEDMYLCQVSWP